MPKIPGPEFSRRERQIMNALYRLGEGAVADIQRAIGDATSYDAVRLTLGVLEEKGHVTHHKDGRRYVYRPKVPTGRAARSAVRQLMKTYFHDSPSRAVLAMLDAADEQLSESEIEEIIGMIRQARKKR